MTPEMLAVFDGLVLYLRDAIGVFGGILYPITFLLCAWGFIRWAINHYMSRGSSDGGGGPLI